jgi:streptogramin lyase
MRVRWGWGCRAPRGLVLDSLAVDVVVSCACAEGFHVLRGQRRASAIRLSSPTTLTSMPAAKEVRGLALEFAPHSSARVAAGKEGLWLTHLVDDDVFRVDPKTGGRIAVVRVGRDPTEIVVGGGFVWVASGRDGTVTRIDPETLDTTVVQVGTTISSMAFGEGALWVVVDVR